MSDGDDDAFYAPVGVQAPGATDPTINNYVMIGENNFDGFDVGGNDGVSHNHSLNMLMVHEITHAALTPTAFPGRYREESVIFVTNYFQSRLEATSWDRVGHIVTPLGASSAFSTEYLLGYNMQKPAILTSATDDSVFVFSDVNDNVITKKYYGEDHDDVDHLITISSEKQDNILDLGALSFVSPTETSIVSNSVVEGMEDKLSVLVASKDALEAFLADVEEMESDGANVPWRSELAFALPYFTANALLTISAERFTSAEEGYSPVNVQGPVASGAGLTLQAPDQLKLEAGPSSTLILGASGVTNLGIPNSDPVYLTATSETLLGGAGDDILMLGDGVRQVGQVDVRNIAAGGLGTDVMIGGLGADSKAVLLGGGMLDIDAAPNLLISSAGEDILVGDYGPTDIVSYAASSNGVTIDLTTTVSVDYVDGTGAPVTTDAYRGFGGDAQGDRYVGVEIFIGSSAASNIFKGGDGGLQAFIGGSESDTFYLTDGNVAYGGAGQDTFYIDTSDSNGRYWLYGVDAGDQVYVDGVQYTGRSQEMERVLTSNPGAPENWSYRITSDESIWGPAYTSSNPIGLQIGEAYREDRLYYGEAGGLPTNQAYLLLTDIQLGTHVRIFMAGWSSGDAGINMDMQYPEWAANGVTGFANTDGNEGYNHTFDPGAYGWDGPVVYTPRGAPQFAMMQSVEGAVAEGSFQSAPLPHEAWFTSRINMINDAGFAIA
jgi:hypothetical protein